MGEDATKQSSPRDWGQVSNWSIVGLLATLGPMVLSELRAREDRQEKNWREAMTRTEAIVSQQSASYQKSISDLVEQWKEDRRMLIDVLKDGKLDASSSTRHGASGRVLLSPEVVRSEVKRWHDQIEEVH